LVEDQELFEVESPRLAKQLRRRRQARLDGVDQESLLGIALPQFLFGVRRRDLLVNLAAAIGVLQHPLCHV
jgi:hypothetical protein